VLICVIFYRGFVASVQANRKDEREKYPLRLKDSEEDCFFKSQDLFVLKILYFSYSFEDEK